MITKIQGTRNGFQMSEETKNEDFQKILAAHHKAIRCIIINKSLYKAIRPSLFGKNIITVNNRVGDNEFYLNAVL